MILPPKVLELLLKTPILNPDVKNSPLKTKYVIVEYHNSGPWLTKIESKEEITLDKVVDYFTNEEAFDEGKDNIMLIDEINTIKI